MDCGISGYIHAISDRISDRRNQHDIGECDHIPVAIPSRTRRGELLERVQACTHDLAGPVFHRRRRAVLFDPLQDPLVRRWLDVAGNNPDELAHLRSPGQVAQWGQEWLTAWKGFLEELEDGDRLTYHDRSLCTLGLDGQHWNRAVGVYLREDLSELFSLSDVDVDVVDRDLLEMCSYSHSGCACRAEKGVQLYLAAEEIHNVRAGGICFLSSSIYAKVIYPTSPADSLHVTSELSRT